MDDEKKLYITHLPFKTGVTESYQRALCGQIIERRHILRPNDLRPLRCLVCARARQREAADKARAALLNAPQPIRKD